MIPLLILIIESVTFAAQDCVFPLRLPVTSGGDIYHWSRLVCSANILSRITMINEVCALCCMCRHFQMHTSYI